MVIRNLLIAGLLLSVLITFAPADCQFPPGKSVEVTGPDGGDADTDPDFVASCDTIAEALGFVPAGAGMAAGFSVLLTEGLYHESGLNVANRHGTASHPFTIRGKSGDSHIDGAIKELQLLTNPSAWSSSTAGIPAEYFSPKNDAGQSQSTITRWISLSGLADNAVVTGARFSASFDEAELRLWTYGAAKSGFGLPVGEAFKNRKKTNAKPHPIPPHGLFFDPDLDKLFIELPDGENPNARALSISRSEFVLRLNGCSFTTLQNLVVSHGGQACITLLSSSDCTLDRVTTRGGKNGILVSKDGLSSRNTIKNCTALNLYDYSRWYWEDIKITKDDTDGVSFSSKFEKPMEGTGIAINRGDSNKVINCTALGGFNGIGQSGGGLTVTNLEVARCLVSDFMDDGLEFEGNLNGLRVHGNIVADCHAAVSLSPVTASPSTLATLACIYRNYLFSTKSINNEPSTASNRTGGSVKEKPFTFKLTSPGEGHIRIYHNTAWSTGNVIAGKLPASGTTPTIKNTDFLNNIFFVRDVAGCPGVGGSTSVNNSGFDDIPCPGSTVGGPFYDGNLYVHFNNGDVARRWNNQSGASFQAATFSSMQQASPLTKRCVVLNHNGTEFSSACLKWEARGRAPLHGQSPPAVFRNVAGFDVGINAQSNALNSALEGNDCLFKHSFVLGFAITMPFPDDVQYVETPNSQSPSDNRDMGAFELWPEDPQDFFKRGDADQTGTVDIGDPQCILASIFQSGCASMNCLDAADANDDGVVDISDSTFLFLFLFEGGRPPPLPGPGFCGPDPTPEQPSPGAPPDLPCSQYDAACTSLDDLIDESCPSDVSH